MKDLHTGDISRGAGAQPPSPTLQSFENTANLYVWPCWSEQKIGCAPRPLAVFPDDATTAYNFKQCSKNTRSQT